MDWQRVWTRAMAGAVFLGIFIMLVIALWGDSIPKKQYLFDLGLRCLRFTALPAVFPM